MEKVIEIAKNVAIVILALIVAFILFIGLGKLATFAFSSLASAGASLTSVFVPATTTPVVVVGANAPVTEPAGTYEAPGAYSTSSATMVVTQQPQTTQTAPTRTTTYTAPARTTTYVAPRVSYYGLPDLSVSVISTGIVNSAGVFVPQSVIYPGQRAAAQVLVSNIGTNVSGAWTLQAPLPTNAGGETFTSYPQASLTPGSSAKLTLAFNDLRTTNVSSMVITVDPYNQVAESNKSNNQAVATFQMNVNSGYNAGYGYTYPNQTTYTTNTTYGYPYNTYTQPCTTYQGNWNDSSCTNYNNGYNNGYGYGLPDLTVQILSVNGSSYNNGYTNGYNNNSGVYNYNGSYYTGTPVTAEIQITNIGQATANNYTYSTNVNGNNQVTSALEPALAPGQSATYTVNLNSLSNNSSSYYGGNTINVQVNPYNSITESNYSNNFASRSF